MYDEFSIFHLAPILVVCAGQLNTKIE